MKLEVPKAVNTMGKPLDVEKEPGLFLFTEAGRPILKEIFKNAAPPSGGISVWGEDSLCPLPGHIGI